MNASHEIDARVTKVLVQALGVEEDDIKPSATLQGDLGAESIDFLDITFRLEQEFMIKVDRDDLFPEPLLRGDSAILNDGRLTGEGLAALRAQMPYADWGELERDPRLESIDELFTVGLVTSYVRWKLMGSMAADADAGVPAPRRAHEHEPRSPFPAGIEAA